MNPSELPVRQLQGELRKALQTHRRLVVEAPTGSGKSTQIPQMLLEDGAVPLGQIVVLQPRRIAARMLASRVAWERNVKLGGEVGYQVRLESVCGPQTRIRYVTEGILLRQMMSDPVLHGVGAVIFDEFHERHIFGDVSLAMAVLLQKQHRPDLLIAVMSATLEAGALLRYLEPCSRLTCEGRVYPVTVEYSAAAAKVAEKPVWEQAAWHFNRIAREQPAGDFLIFMPGAFEIHRTLAALAAQPEARDFVLLPLHGELPTAQQDAALEQYEKRKAVVATNVAETSLTIDGVRIVIDSGLARVPAYDPHRGINTLLVQKISQASAAQRTGRAGRTAPGYCLRLWGEREHEHRPVHDLPEIRRLDLSDIALTLKSGGISDLNNFPWFEPPEQKSLGNALRLLKDLGALDAAAGEVTEVGLRMASFPLHPRYSRMFLAAESMGCLRQMALLAAFADGRNFLLPLHDKKADEERDNMLRDKSAELSDFFYLFNAWKLAADNKFDESFCRRWGIHALAARQAGEMAGQFLQIARAQGLNTAQTAADSDALRRCLLTGFSDHVSKRLDRGTLRCAIVHGRKGEMRRQSIAHQSPLFVSSDIEERNTRGEVAVLLGLNTAIEEQWLREMFPCDFSDRDNVYYDARSKRVCCCRERRFRDLILESKETGQPPPDEAARLLAVEVSAGRLALNNWDATVETFIARVNLIAKHCPEHGFTPIGANEKQLLIEQICFGAASHKEIKDRDVWPAVRGWLTAGQRGLLDRLAPERCELPSGANPKIRYEDGGKAALTATIQQLYNAPNRVKIAGGKVALVIEILAPNHRPVQITENLGDFWERIYPDIKKQLRARYPKHEWR